MPFDPPAPAPLPASIPRAASLGGQTAVAIWLFGLCGMILVMVTLGGATRLSGSGLSIMEWAPLMGTLPPLSEAEWDRLFTLYQRIPQYGLVNQGFGLAGFKGIFWLEWTHRLWGRLMGVAFVLPLLWFVVRRRIGASLGLRLTMLLALGGLQGAVGWFMVASGFEADRTAVSPYRLVIHLGLAVALYAAILWTGLGQWPRGRPAGRRRPALRHLAATLSVLVFATILAGGFVAGLKAGLTYNSFPLMDGRWVPAGYGALEPWYRNLVENVAAVQFDHRLLATATAVLAAVTVFVGLRGADRRIVLTVAALGVAVVAQYGIGIATLLWAVPLPLGVAHQAMAMVVLTASLVLLYGQRRGSLADVGMDA